MSDEDVRARFDALRAALTPLEGAPEAIELAVARRRRRPVVVTGTLAGIAATAIVAAALLPNLGSPPSDFASASLAATETVAPSTGPWVGFEPIATTGGTVGEWAASADVLVVVSGTAVAGAADAREASVIEIPWRRSYRPETPAGGFGLDALPLGAEGEISIPTAAGTPPEVAIAPGEEYLLALRWEHVRCDAAPPGWVLLGDDAVLPHALGIVTGARATPAPSDDELPELDDPVALAFAGLETATVADTLDGVRAAHDVSRAAGFCE